MIKKIVVITVITLAVFKFGYDLNRKNSWDSEIKDYTRKHKVHCELDTWDSERNCTGINGYKNGKSFYKVCDHVYTCSDGHNITVRF